MISGPKNKVVLTGLQLQNLDQFRRWRNDPLLRRYFREFRELTDDMQHDWYEKRVKGNQNQFDFEIHAWNSLCFNTNPESWMLLGHTSLNYVNWTNRTAEFGIYIGEKQYRNGGYGSDALRALLSYGFDTLNLNRIWCEVFSNNDAIQVYRHLGFKDEGTLRHHHYDEGKYWDSYMLGMLKSEWEEMKNVK
jgi:RimJ/RimL family protein N-acetyltransferase